MKVLIVGDPHGSEKVKKIPVKGVDLILITGDMGKSDILRKIAFENTEREKKGLPPKYSSAYRKKGFMQTYNSAVKILKYFSKFAPVYVVFGNIEKTNPQTIERSEQIGIKLPFLENTIKKMKGVRAINHKSAKFKGLKIGGINNFIDVSWVKTFASKDKSFMKRAKKETGRAKKTLNKFGRVDILLCHQPPYSVLDKVNFPQAPKHWQGKHAGSKTILNYIKKKQPRYVFCGHIHEGKGKKRVGETIVYNAGVAGDYVLLDIE